jgi:hypothetical protein
MTRCCSSFSNCSPESVGVTITNETHVYEVGGSQIGWRQERFAVRPSVMLGYSALTLGAGQILLGSQTMSYTAYATLASTPVAKHAVQVFFANGSVPQRPLVGTAGVPTGTNDGPYDYFVVGQRVYFAFEFETSAESTDSLFIHYVGTPLAGSTGISTGDMDTIAVTGYSAGPPEEFLDSGLAAQAPAGWCLADGYTPYLKSAYPALYAFLDSRGLLSPNSVTTDPADGQNLVSHDIDSEISFVIRYLAPYSYGAQGTNPDGSTHPTRSLTHRVVVKA